MLCTWQQLDHIELAPRRHHRRVPATGAPRTPPLRPLALRRIQPSVKIHIITRQPLVLPQPLLATRPRPAAANRAHVIPQRCSVQPPAIPIATVQPATRRVTVTVIHRHVSIWRHRRLLIYGTLPETDRWAETYPSPSAVILHCCVPAESVCRLTVRPSPRA